MFFGLKERANMRRVFAAVVIVEVLVTNEKEKTSWENAETFLRNFLLEGFFKGC